MTEVSVFHRHELASHLARRILDNSWGITLTQALAALSNDVEFFIAIVISDVLGKVLASEAGLESLFACNAAGDDLNGCLTMVCVRCFPRIPCV